MCKIQKRRDGCSSETLLAPCTRKKRLQRKMTKDYYCTGVQESIDMFTCLLFQTCKRVNSFSTETGYIEKVINEDRKYMLGYESIPELENASDTVKRLFEIEIMSRRDKQQAAIEDLTSKYETDREKQIAKYTFRIKNVLEHCMKNKQSLKCVRTIIACEGLSQKVIAYNDKGPETDKHNKVLLIWLIDQRKKSLKKLKLEDLRKYTDIIKDLDIPPLQNPDDPHNKYKFRKFKINVPLKKKRELHEFEADRCY